MRVAGRGHYSERDAANAFRSIAAVIAHCHNMGVMHRDIKPENFLLSNRSKHAVVKGTDFGLSCFFSEGQMFNEVVGSAFYVAPEVLRKKYDKRADIWSLGVLLYILLCGMPPFYAETEKDIFHAILSSELSFEAAPWPSISEAAKDVIRKMLERNPARRATAAEVLQHEWVRENGSAAAAPLNNEVIATHLPENEISGLKALFMEMDADGSGSITVDELREVSEHSPSHVNRLVGPGDLDGGDTIQLVSVPVVGLDAEGEEAEPPTLVQQATPRRLQHAMSADTEAHCKGAVAMLEHSAASGMAPELHAMAAVSFKSTVGG
ncbi:hypothetical protein GPECTOR_640g749 [Gonium pectorale]|uniref:Uncharacterized protein n=1 Tax=Gonium pectorale TaxID=33097 RepID=A0A150FUB6_GONPE|nr:hypothetical protein GPECTOR_640g749 [Gonium pectorale]|eukprot:KXZ41221.1 hypothetical protein GPECTOR_640g749 [Gonium pectorale]